MSESSSSFPSLQKKRTAFANISSYFRVTLTGIERDAVATSPIVRARLPGLADRLFRHSAGRVLRVMTGDIGQSDN